ncbi:MAG: nitroreductase family protein [Flavobacteriales bacterium]
MRLKSDRELSDHIKNNINQKFKLSSHVICMSRDENEVIPEWEELAATSMSVQNMWLTCTSYDLGCY